MLPFANYYISTSTMSENIVNNSKRRKKKRPMMVYGGGGGDDLAVVKAAAWAWYQRKEGKPIMREFEITRAPRTPRPSRYKIEATKNMILSDNKVLAENRVSKSSLWYTNFHYQEDQETQYSRLLDTYEIKNISKGLHFDDPCLSMSLSSAFMRDDDNHNHGCGCDDHVSTVCGRSDDVNLRASKASRRTVKVSAAAEALLRSAASDKTQTGRR
ncbi:hypothetical protein Bca4012_027157 [Brassica carinata]